MPTARVWLTFALSGLGLVSRLAAQATGVPLRNAGGPSGIWVGVDVGLGKIKRANAGDDVSRAIAGAVGVSFGPLGLSGTLSRTTLDPASGPSRGISAGLVQAEIVAIGGPLLPFRLAWQGSYARELGGNDRPWRTALGVGAALTIPTVVVSIRPWLAPRLEYRGAQPVRGGRLKTALAGGVDAGLLNGMTIRLGYDNRLGWDSAVDRAAGISLGISYSFR